MPYENEPRGPVGELVAAASAEVRAEALDDDQAMAQAWQQGVEPEGIEATQIAAIVVATLVAVAVLVGTGIAVTYGGIGSATVVAEDVDAYPELVQSEVAAIDKIGDEAWGVVSAEDGVYRIPVSAAMEVVASRYQQQQAGNAGYVAPPTFWSTQDLVSYDTAPAGASAAPVTPLVPSTEPPGLNAGVTPLGPDDLGAADPSDDAPQE